MKFWHNPNFPSIFFLIILSIPALKALTIPGFYSSHDGETHTARMAQYYQALVDGQFPPRMAGTLYSGLGSPILTYIYPMPYILGSAVHALGFTFVDSFKMVMALEFILSGIFFYLWTKEVLGSEKAAFLGALFYVWVPYRFLLIYVRGSISENTAYTFLPLLLYAATRLVQKRNLTNTALTAISAGFFLMSQDLIAMISIPIIAGFVLLLAIFKRSLKYFLLVGIAGAWGFLISTFVYLPSLLERNFVRFDEIYAQVYIDHFVCLKQFFYSSWGYGFSLPGCNDLMSFQLGLAHWVIVGLFILILVYLSFRRILRGRTIPNGENFILAFFFFVAFITYSALMIRNPQIVSIWQHFDLLGRIDYPWRLLGPAAFCVAFLAAFVAKTIKPGLVFLLLIMAVLIANRHHLNINQSLAYDNKFFANYTGTATQLGEFTPKWRQTTRVPIGFDPNKRVTIVSGQVDINNLAAKSNKILFYAQVSSPSAQILVNKFYFPGVIVKIDDKKLQDFKDLTVTGVDSLKLDTEKETSGLMVLDVASGIHRVSVNYGETPVRLFADYLSLSAFVLALGALLIKNAKKIKS